MEVKKTISNSFTVSTVEDGATLTVKSAIHSVGIRCTSDGKSDGSGSSAGLVTLYIDGAAAPTTSLSIKSKPSGLTVLTHAQQSAVPEGGVSISWVNNVDRVNLEGEVVLTVSYNSYSTEFSIPIICAKDGEDGTSVKQVFKRALSQPTTPTGLNPSGWSDTPPAQNTGASEYLTSGDYAGWNKLTTQAGSYSKDVISFVTTYPNEKVVIRIKSSSEANYDFIYIAALDTSVAAFVNYYSIASERKASGENVEKYVETIVPTVGFHTLDVVYQKDQSGSYYLDCGFYQIITAGDRIWASVATIKGSTVIGSWSTPVVWNGKEGRDGQDGERGKVGRFYYYSGFDWDASNTTNKFVVNDAQVPFFSKAGSNSDKYYVFNREETPSGGEMTMAQMATETSVGGQIQWNKTPWKIMTDDFKYLITEAIFSSFAKLGSFIISGDFFISQYGTLVSYDGTETIVDSTNYKTIYGGKVPYAWFSESDPMAEGSFGSGYRFRPSKCINALTGEEYSAKGNYRISADGDVRMTGALMCSKIVRTVALASTFNMFTGSTGATLKLKTDYLLLYGPYSSEAKIQLPPAKFFKGAKVKIINGTARNDSPDPSVIKFSVYHSSATETNAEDNFNVSLNSMAVSAPIINGLTHNLFPYDYYTEVTIEGYTSIELMSAPNFYHQDNSPYYVWMVVDGRELQTI